MRRILGVVSWQLARGGNKLARGQVDDVLLFPIHLMSGFAFVYKSGRSMLIVTTSSQTLLFTGVLLGEYTQYVGL